MKVLAFVGPKGSGKDTCANLLKKDKKVKASVSFALPLKRICSQVFEVHMNLLTDPVLKEKALKEPIKVTKKHLRAIKDLMVEYVDPYEPTTYYNLNRATDSLVSRVFTTPREILQIIGTEYIRDQFHLDWHCMAAFSQKNLDIVLRGATNTTVAVTDCRFENEFKFLVSRFGNNAKFYYVERPEAEKRLAKATHRSETSILDVKELIMLNDGILIKNDGSLEELEAKLKELKLPKATAGKAAEKPAPGSRFRFAPR